jgi:hypothetical protein
MYGKDLFRFHILSVRERQPLQLEEMYHCSSTDRALYVVGVITGLKTLLADSA